MNKNTNKFYLQSIIFKSILREKGLPQIAMARDLGWSHTKLNWFVRGYYAPSDEDRHKICAYLCIPEQILFTPKD